MSLFLALLAAIALGTGTFWSIHRFYQLGYSDGRRKGRADALADVGLQITNDEGES